MSTISSNHLSHDQQLADVVTYMSVSPERAHDYAQFLREFPDWSNLKWSGSWIDTEATGVDVEWPMWATDWIEQNTPIYWEDGKPWIDEA